jgi:membrane associated rhomboid family serine protease
MSELIDWKTPMFRRPLQPPGDPRDAVGTPSDALESLRPRHRPVATLCLLGALVLVYIAQVLDPELVEAIAVTPEALHGEPWRIATGALAHGSEWHLAANAYFGWFVGARLERHIGAVRLLLISAASLLGAGLLVAARGQAAVGFSGVVFGWFASWLAFHLTPRFPGLRLSGPQRAAYIQNLVLNLLISALPGISGLAHLGGFASGFAVAYLLGLTGAPTHSSVRGAPRID